MRGRDVEEVLEAVLPTSAMLEDIRTSGMQKRARKLDALELVRSAVLAAGNGGSGRQAAILESYFASHGGVDVVRGAAYSWFSPAFETVMQSSADRAMTYARGLAPDLPGFLGEHVVDWHAFDSTTVRLDDSLVGAYPSTGSHAALKVHKRFSIGVGATVGYHLSSAREHDSPHLTLDESWRGHGLLADLGYASFRLLRQAQHYDTRFVIRLKESWKPKVMSIEAGDVKGTFARGADFDMLLDDEVLHLSGPSIDADVRLGAKDPVDARLVGVEHDGAYRWYLTDLPRSVTPEQIAQLYRVRWEIEIDNRLNKSNFNMDEISARTPHTARALVHASIAASILTCVLAYKHRVEEGRPRRPGTDRKVPPAHPSSIGRAMAASALRIAEMLAGERDASSEAWDALAQILTKRGFDPNWRRSPSMLDQLRGWRVRPAKSRGGGRKKKKTPVSTAN